MTRREAAQGAMWWLEIHHMAFPDTGTVVVRPCRRLCLSSARCSMNTGCVHASELGVFGETCRLGKQCR